MSAAVLALLLLATPPDPAADLWARLNDPSIPTAERAQLAEQAKDVLTPEYIPKVAALKVALDLGHGRGDMRVILEHVEIPSRDADPYALVRDLPCRTQFDGFVIAETLRRFPMNAETYGVMRNLVTPRKEEFFSRDLPEWWTFAGRDDWHAAQAFVVDLANTQEGDGPAIITELIAGISRMMFDLERMIARMKPFPATAFLALADRITREPVRETNECNLAYDAARLVQSLDDPPFGEEGLHTTEQCHARLEQFRDWLSDHRAELEALAREDAAQIEEARARMERVTLCRP